MQLWRRNLYAVWFTQLLSLVGFGFGLPFIPFYIQELGITDPVSLKFWTGLLTAMPGVALAIMAPVWGYLADKYGKKLMLARAMLGASIVLAGLGLSKSIYAVFIFRILQGAITGTVTSSSALVATGTPVKRLSYALGFLSSSTFIGYSLGPAVGGIIAEYFGYRMSFFIGSAILLAGFFLVILIIKEPVQESDDIIKIPDTENSGHKLKLITPSIIALFVILFFMRMSRTLPTPFLPLYIQELRGSIEGSASITGLLSGGIGLVSALSGLTLARLGDTMDRSKLLYTLSGLGVVVSLSSNFLGGVSGLFISLMLTYFFIGGIEPLVMSLTSEKVPSANRGFLFGIQTMVGSTAWFISPVLGSFISINLSLDYILIFFTILLGITFLITLLLRNRVSDKASLPEQF